MRIVKFRALNGPNIYHRNPVLIMTLDLEDFAELSSEQLPGFTERLLAALPGLKTHRCSPGYEGGFVERLTRGTYFAHIIEHIALELSGPAGVEVGFGKSVYGGRHGIYQVIVRYKIEQSMEHILKTAVALAEAIAKNQNYPLTARIEEAKQLTAEYSLGPSTKAIVDAAENLDIPWLRLNDQNLIQFGYGKNRKLIEATTSSQTNNISVSIAGDKDLTKKLLSLASIRVPRGQVANSVEEALEAFEDLGVPVAIKPLYGNQGKGVSLNLTTPQQVREAFVIAQEFSSAVLVEELFVGNDYRILVVGGKMVAASLRLPAHVTGDGHNTLSQLIQNENFNPLRGEGHEKPMTKIRIDEVAANFLRDRGISLESVPAAGERIFLRGTANLSTGGSAEDVTDTVHPEIRMICERAARIVGLDICGIDFVINDITATPTNQRGGIIEVNAGPGIRMHHFPARGRARDAGGAIVKMLYPQGGASSRIPIISITGTNGKTTVTRLVSHLLTHAGIQVGMTSSDGIYVGGECVARGDTTGPISARSVLCDPAVEVAVLETARGGIVRRGLGYDWSDVGILTNIQRDHIGQDGIEDISDLVRIKALVAETVKAGGTLVLNADDAEVMKLAESEHLNKIKREKILFSLDPASFIIRRHLSAGGRALYLKEGWIVEATDQGENTILMASAIPLTFRGTAKFHIANVLAACGAGLAHGLSWSTMVEGLLSFRPAGQNRGRTNLFRVGQSYALIDYGHNPEAFRAVTTMTATWSAPRITGVVAVPGDRDDSVLKEAARLIAQGFDRVVIREDVDLRGRKPGEAANVLKETILGAVPDFDCRVELDEAQVAETVISELVPGEVVVFFYDNFQLIRDILSRHGAVPIEELPLEVTQASAASEAETKAQCEPRAS